MFNVFKIVSDLQLYITFFILILISASPDMSSLNSNASAKPPVLSPHGKIPQGFSLELAERLKTSSTSLSSVATANTAGGGGTSNVLEKPFKPGVVPYINMAALSGSSLDSRSMESKSNLISSSAIKNVARLDVSSFKKKEEVGAAGISDGGVVIVLTLSSRLRSLHLIKWSLSDVVDVLKVNGCSMYASLFIKKVKKKICLYFLCILFCLRASFKQKY